MGKWEELSIEKLFKIKSGNFIKRNEVSEEGLYPVFGGNGITGFTKDFNLEGENIIIGRVGAKCGNTRLINGKIWLTDNAFYISEYFKDFDKTFLRLFLEHFDLGTTANQAAQPVISYKSIKEIKIPLPPLPEQQRIVAKLDGLFAKIDQAISLLEANLQHTQALMGSVLDEEFGRLDCEWYKLQDVTKIVGGGTPKTAISEYWADEIIWLSPTDLPPIGVISTVKDSSKKISSLGLQKSSAKLLPKGSVVYSSRASIGKIAITECELSTNQGFTNFIPNEGLNNVYLAKTLKHFTPKIEALSNSTTFKEVSKTALKKFEIPVPDYQTQLELSQLFSEYQNLIDKSVETQTQKLNHLKALKSSLLDQAFKGAL